MAFPPGRAVFRYKQMNLLSGKGRSKRWRRS